MPTDFDHNKSPEVYSSCIMGKLYCRWS